MKKLVEFNLDLKINYGMSIHKFMKVDASTHLEVPNSFGSYLDDVVGFIVTKVFTLFHCNKSFYIISL